MGLPDIIVRDSRTVQTVDELLAGVDENAMNYVLQSKAPNTLRSYQSDWAHFEAWCNAVGLESLPATPKTIARYLTFLVDAEQLKISTLQRRISAISQKHKQRGYDPITTRVEPLHSVWEGIRRAKGTAQTGKSPAVIEDIRLMVATLSDTTIGRRDRALLLVGFAGAFRRSELVGLNVEDAEFNREGLVITLRRSKTDQEGQGRRIGIPFGSYIETCPVRSLQDWIQAACITAGPLFLPVTRHGRVMQSRLSDKAVALVVKRSAERAGLNAASYSGHSLRAGLATSAAQAGIRYDVIKKQTRHSSDAMLQRYIRDGQLFKENAAAGVGL